jgi:hypothetical protein
MIDTLSGTDLLSCVIKRVKAVPVAGREGSKRQKKNLLLSDGQTVQVFYGVVSKAYPKYKASKNNIAMNLATGAITLTTAKGEAVSA